MYSIQIICQPEGSKHEVIRVRVGRRNFDEMRKDFLQF